ncbi:MAG: CinA family nicotinamide mononucleotide deamidase-related protein [Desulfobacterales bacterium]|jgi:nicotinamide-nucleotide amidase|nr:CinA family nicotinamide mononucleotide deamidase-related protein [Desulfobacterales bacterium]
MEANSDVGVTAEILATGEEIRTGALVDSNSGTIAEQLELVGVKVVRLNGVGDELNRLTAILKEIGSRANVCVVTGGLGPTVDDLSARAAADAAGVGLHPDPAALASIEDFFRRRNRPMNPSIHKQALLPIGAEVLFNPVGTAPGFQLRIGRCGFFFLPGVPFEMKRMLADHVLPRIERMLGGFREVRRIKTLSCFGLTESLTGERLDGLGEQFPGVQLGLRARFPEIQVKLYASGADEARVAEALDQAAGWVRGRLGDLVFSDSGEPMEAVVGRLMRERNASLAVAESCTGGLVSHWLTEVAGSSDYFRLAAVTYANDVKTSVLGVSEETLARCGAVHADIARDMAEGVRRLAGATYGIATSGIAGPAGGSAEKPVGTVCIGLAAPGQALGYRFQFNYGRRSMNKQMFAMKALDVLRRELLGLAHTS